MGREYSYRFGWTQLCRELCNCRNRVALCGSSAPPRYLQAVLLPIGVGAWTDGVGNPRVLTVSRSPDRVGFGVLVSTDWFKPSVFQTDKKIKCAPEALMPSLSANHREIVRVSGRAFCFSIIVPCVSFGSPASAIDHGSFRHGRESATKKACPFRRTLLVWISANGQKTPTQCPFRRFHRQQSR